MSDQMTDINANDWLLSGGVRSASFKQIGDSVTGFILRPPEVQQIRNFDSGQPEYWPDGKPKMQIRAVLMTEERDPADPEDSGERAVYIRANVQRAVAQAVRQSGAKGLEVGGKLMVKYTGDGKASKRGFNPPKLYEAKYRAPTGEPVAVPEPPAAQPSSSNDAEPF
jgi:hypothetical protein